MTRVITGSDGRKYLTNEPLLHPPQREWVGLTEWQIAKVLQQCQDELTRPPSEEFAFKFARAIEAKLKEKNT